MIEKKIKALIILQYGSVRAFSDKIKIPYTTVDTILKRGIFKSSILNVLKICKELNIDVNKLIDNKLVIKDK